MKLPYDSAFHEDKAILYSLYLRHDPVMTIYIRSVQSMLEFLGDIGGLIQIVALFVFGFVGFIIERNFKAAILSDVYKVQKYHRDNTEFYKSATEAISKKTHKLTSESESSGSQKSESDSES